MRIYWMMKKKKISIQESKRVVILLLKNFNRVNRQNEITIAAKKAKILITLSKLIEAT